MKKWMIVFLGVMTGLLVASVVYFVFLSPHKDKVDDDEDTQDMEQVDDDDEEDDEDEKDEEDESAPQSLNDITFFDEVGDVIDERSFQVMHVISTDAALVHGNDENGAHRSTIYLITNKENKYYNDNEIITVPQGKVARQIGEYHHYTSKEAMTTVPIIMIMDKD